MRPTIPGLSFVVCNLSHLDPSDDSDRLWDLVVDEFNHLMVGFTWTSAVNSPARGCD